MAKEAFLTPVQQKNLIDYIVGHSENYANYIAWCDREEIPDHRRYTAFTWPVWCQNKRTQIKLAREEHRKATWGGSTFDRNVRLRELEGMYERLRGLIPADVKETLAIEASRLKVLEMITRERGEANPKPLASEDDAKSKVDAALAKAFGKPTSTG